MSLCVWFLRLAHSLISLVYKWTSSAWFTCTTQFCSQFWSIQFKEEHPKTEKNTSSDFCPFLHRLLRDPAWMRSCINNIPSPTNGMHAWSSNSKVLALTASPCSALTLWDCGETTSEVPSCLKVGPRHLTQTIGSSRGSRQLWAAVNFLVQLSRSTWVHKWIYRCI